jgi:NADPH2:quinone reductase
MKALQMQSCVHENATVECALVEIAIPDPKPDEVVVAVEAAPINPSDLGLMFGAADLSSVREVERNGQPALLLDVPAAAMRAMAPRVGHWMAVGNEGSGRVIAAGDGEAAQALARSASGHVWWRNVRGISLLASSASALPFPDTISAEQAASLLCESHDRTGFSRDARHGGPWCRWCIPLPPLI